MQKIHVNSIGIRQCDVLYLDCLSLFHEQMWRRYRNKFFPRANLMLKEIRRSTSKVIPRLSGTCRVLRSSIDRLSFLHVEIHKLRQSSARINGIVYHVKTQLNKTRPSQLHSITFFIFKVEH